MAIQTPQEANDTFTTYYFFNTSAPRFQNNNPNTYSRITARKCGYYFEHQVLNAFYEANPGSTKEFDTNQLAAADLFQNQVEAYVAGTRGKPEIKAATIELRASIEKAARQTVSKTYQKMKDYIENQNAHISIQVSNAPINNSIGDIFLKIIKDGIEQEKISLEVKWQNAVDNMTRWFGKGDAAIFGEGLNSYEGYLRRGRHWYHNEPSPGWEENVTTKYLQSFLLTKQPDNQALVQYLLQKGGKDYSKFNVSTKLTIHGTSAGVEVNNLEDIGRIISEGTFGAGRGIRLGMGDSWEGNVLQWTDNMGHQLAWFGLTTLKSSHTKKTHESRNIGAKMTFEMYISQKLMHSIL